jgi:NAD(P)-dependent dehydrogenase (short-subunit alcohol dehydrogenase family)
MLPGVSVLSFITKFRSKKKTIRNSCLLATITTVTGGAGTLALESARSLLEHGVSGVALWDVSFAHASTAVAALNADFPSASLATVVVDVRNSKSVNDAMTTTIEKLGSVNVLCCFAGVVSCGSSVDVGVEEWRRVLDINCTGGFLCAQAFARFVLFKAYDSNALSLTLKQSSYYATIRRQHSIHLLP